MWPRVVEVMLGCWLMISPFIFRFAGGETFLWVVSLVAGAVLIAIALLACWPKAEKLRLANLLVVAGLIGIAFFLAPGAPPPAPPYQNFVVVGLLVLVTAIIPTRTTLPPRSWQAFYERRARR